MKGHASCSVRFNIIKDDEVQYEPTYHFTGKSRTIIHEEDVEQETDIMVDRLEEQIQDQQARGSNFVFKDLPVIHVSVCDYQPLRGGSYLPLPPSISNKHAVLNIQSNDDLCIIDSILASLHPCPHRHRYRPRYYHQFRHEINYQGVAFPISRAGIQTLENLNKDLSINVYSYDVVALNNKRNNHKVQEHVFFPWRISKRRGEGVKCIDLLLITEGERRHFALIEDLARLTRSSNSKSHRTTFVCRYCLVHHTNERQSLAHEELCVHFKPSCCIYPKPGETFQYNGRNKQMESPYFISMDFETKQVMKEGPTTLPERAIPPGTPKKYPWITFPSEARHVELCRSCSLYRPCEAIQRSTEKLCYLEAFSFGYKIVSADGQGDFPLRIYQAPGCLDALLVMLKQDMIRLYEELHRNVPMIITTEEQRSFDQATTCNACGDPFTSSATKHRDHHHQTGLYRQALCARCNLAYHPGAQTGISAFCHNFSGFDAHLCISAAAADSKHVRNITNILEKNMEQLIGFTMEF